MDKSEILQKAKDYIAAEQDERFRKEIEDLIAKEDYTELEDRFYQTLAFYSCTVSNFEQYTLAHFIGQGYFEKHLNRMRVCYRNRRKELTALLRPYGSRLRMIGAAAGSYALVQVDVGLDEQGLCAAASRLGVRVWPISPYFMGPVPTPYRACVLLGYGNLTKEQMARGVALLAKAWGLDEF